MSSHTPFFVFTRFYSSWILITTIGAFNKKQFYCAALQSLLVQQKLTCVFSRTLKCHTLQSWTAVSASFTENIWRQKCTLFCSSLNSLTVWTLRERRLQHQSQRESTFSILLYFRGYFIACLYRINVSNGALCYSLIFKCSESGHF